MTSIENSPDTSRWSAENLTLEQLIFAVYDVKIFSRLKGVPGWASETHYDISARGDDALDRRLSQLPARQSLELKQSMLKALLSERFQLRIHRDTEVGPVYELKEMSSASHLIQPAVTDERSIATCYPFFQPGKGIEIESSGCPFEFLIDHIVQEMGTTVTNRTSFSGGQRFHIRWKPWNITVADEGEAFPMMQDALRTQLGLHLVKQKGRVTTWIVDSVSRPTPN